MSNDTKDSETASRLEPLVRQFVDELIDKCGNEKVKTAELSVFDDVGRYPSFECGWYGFLSSDANDLNTVICANVIHCEKGEITANEAERFIDEATEYFEKTVHGLVTV